MAVVDLTNIKGVYTNADHDDLPDSMVYDLVNLKPENGRLIKTRGIGDLISAFTNTTDYVTYGLYTWVEDRLTTPTGYRIILLEIHATTKLLKSHYWNGTTWTDQSVGTFYHKADYNPVIFDGGIVRVLPGNVGKADDTNQSKPLWTGFIDRKVFNDNYTMTEAINNYTANVTSAISVSSYTHYESTDDLRVQDNYRYKIATIYDGNQESLLSAGSVHIDIKKKAVKIRALVDYTDTANYQKRITGMVLYRAEQVSGKYGEDKQILRVDFTGDDIPNIVTPPSAVCTTTSDNVLVVDSDVSLPTNWWNNPTSHLYSLYIDDIKVGEMNNTPQYNMTSGNTWFGMDDDIPDVFETDWTIKKTLNSNGSLVDTLTGSGNGYGGPNLILLYTWTGTAMSDAELSNQWMFITDNGSARIAQIKTATTYSSHDSDERLIQMDRDKDGISAKSVQVLPLYGFTEPVDGKFFVDIYDVELVEGATYPLQGEVSIDVNGRFARTVQGRLFQGDIVLDPGDKAEVHNNWVSYSELDQYDVNPVSNVISFPDKEGGPITGLAELFGKLVIMKKQAMFFLNASASSPASWVIQESVHNIGNIATRGSVEAFGKVYVCYYDGIYAFTPNSMAESDGTPTEKLKISGPIENIYLGVLDKEAIIAEYDQYAGEVIFFFGPTSTVYDSIEHEWSDSSYEYGSDDYAWAYNVSTGDWRQISSSANVGIVSYDQDANLIIYDSTDTKIKSMGKPEEVQARVRTKFYNVDDGERLNTRTLRTRYKSNEGLTLKVFGDHDITSPVDTVTLPVSSSVTEQEVVFRHRFNDVAVEIEETTASDDNVEIHRVTVEPGFTRNRNYRL
tara:strand:+ start:8834 stop:11365 length:2532 start_codon:yes stop_codon:yes gene_type:complete